MNATFDEAVGQLWRKLGLTPPPADNMQSLSVGDCAVHITEQPEQHILMFSCVAADQSVNATMVNEQNAFGGSAVKPIITMDDTSQHWLIWNRQALSSCDTERLVEQLEHVVDCAEQFCKTETASV